MSCIGATRASIDELLALYRSHGIRRLVALRGDLPSGMVDHGEFRYASDLVAFIRERTGTWFHIEMAAYGDDLESIRGLGHDVVAALCERLLAGGVPALHFYTMNPSAPSLALWAACRR